MAHLNPTIGIGHEPKPFSPKRAQRIIERIKTFGLFGPDKTGATYHRATTIQELEQAFRLVHDVYLEAGFIHPQKNGIRMRHFECSPDTGTFVAKNPSHAIIGTMSVILDSDDFGLPCEHIYPEEIRRIRAQGGKMCEFSNQTVLKEFRRKGPSTELMRCAFAYAYSKGVSDIIFAVSPNVVSFYEMMRFVPIGPTRSYSDIVNDPVVLINVPNIQTRGDTALKSNDPAYRFFMHYFYQGNPYFQRLHAWNILNQRMYSDQFEFAVLLSKCPEIILEDRYRAGLERRLGYTYELTRDAILNQSSTRQVNGVGKSILRHYRYPASHTPTSNTGRSSRISSPPKGSHFTTIRRQFAPSESKHRVLNGTKLVGRVENETQQDSTA